MCVRVCVLLLAPIDRCSSTCISTAWRERRSTGMTMMTKGLIDKRKRVSYSRKVHLRNDVLPRCRMLHCCDRWQTTRFVLRVTSLLHDSFLFVQELFNLNTIWEIFACRAPVRVPMRIASVLLGTRFDVFVKMDISLVMTLIVVSSSCSADLVQWWCSSAGDQCIDRRWMCVVYGNAGDLSGWRRWRSTRSMLLSSRSATMSGRPNHNNNDDDNFINPDDCLDREVVFRETSIDWICFCSSFGAGWRSHLWHMPWQWRCTTSIRNAGSLVGMPFTWEIICRLKSNID